MSRGLSKKQQAILKLLRSHTRHEPHSIEVEAPGAFGYSADWCADDGYGGLLTREIVDELPPSEHERAKDQRAPLRQAMSATRRALDSLVKRGLVAGRYTKNMDSPRGWELCWTARRTTE